MRAEQRRLVAMRLVVLAAFGGLALAAIFGMHGDARDVPEQQAWLRHAGYPDAVCTPAAGGPRCVSEAWKLVISVQCFDSRGSCEIVSRERLDGGWDG